MTSQEPVQSTLGTSDDRTSDDQTKAADGSQSQDLRRAKKLVDLHYEMKNKYRNGTVDDELTHLRDEVNRVLLELSSIHKS